MKKKWLPIAVIIVAMMVVYFLEFDRFFSFEMLKQKREIILNYTQSHPILSPVLFMLIYALVVALSLPAGAIFSIIGGFLFPVPFGMIYVLFGATAGAVGIFLAAKTAFGGLLKKRASRFLQKMEKGFQQNAWSYLLFLRLAFIFPFWLVNLSPAFFAIPLWTFTWTTFVGIIPGSFVYTQAGSGLGEIFDAGQSFTFDTVFNTKMKIAIVCIALISLVPIIVKKYRKKTHD